MKNANGVIKKLTSAERSYYTAAEVRESPSLFVRILYIKVTFFFAVYPFMVLNTTLSSDSMDHAESAKQNCTYALIFPA